MNKKELKESIEMIRDAQVDLDQVIERVRQAVQGTPAESYADAYTLPGLVMMSHEEGHGYLGIERGNLDALVRDLEEVVEESEEIEREDIGDAELDEAPESIPASPGDGSGMGDVLSVDGTEIDESKQVKIHDQPDRVRDVLTVLSVEQLVILRRATRGFDGHPGVDSSTIVYYKPEFLAVALIGWVEDHVKQVVDQGMSSRDLTITLEILEKFHRAGFPGVSQEDLSHVEMERDDEMGREVFKANKKVIEGGAE